MAPAAPLSLPTSDNATSLKFLSLAGLIIEIFLLPRLQQRGPLKLFGHYRHFRRDRAFHLHTNASPLKLSHQISLRSPLSLPPFTERGLIEPDVCRPRQADNRDLPRSTTRTRF